MPKIAYRPKKFRAERQKIILQADEIIEEYQAQGFSITVRQLYYQFISRDLFPETWRDPVTHSKNNPKSAGRIIGIIVDARLAGLIDWEAIVDRTRKMVENQHWESPQEIIEVAAKTYQIDTRQTQPIYIEVWVEKEALAGIVEKTCKQLDVPSFACRGYASITSIWEAAQRICREMCHGSKEKYLERGVRKAIILHLGDHDPSGVDMTRDIQDRLNTFECSAVVKRIALNMNQVKKHKPPPNPAKETDTRAKDYISKFGTASWELDALEPSVLISLIKNNVNKLTDKSLLEEMQMKQEDERETLQDIADNL